MFWFSEVLRKPLQLSTTAESADTENSPKPIPRGVATILSQVGLSVCVNEIEKKFQKILQLN